MSRVPQDLIELMAKAGYECSRRGRSLPPWEATSEFWRTAALAEMETALRAAIDAGKLVVAP